MSESPHLSYIQERLGSKLLEVIQPQADDVVILDRANLRESFRLLKEDTQLDYDFLSDITAVDYWRKKEPRFEVVYQVVSRGAGAKGCACVCRCRKTIRRSSR